MSKFDNMNVVLVRNKYNCDYVTKKIYEKMRIDAESIKVNTIFDMKGLVIEDGWLNSSVKKMLRNPYIHFRTYGQEEEIKILKAQCVMMGVEHDRIDNVPYVPVKTETKEEKAIKIKTEWLKNMATFEDNTCIIRYQDAGGQNIESNQFVYALYLALIEKMDSKNIKKAIFDLQRTDNVAQFALKKMVELKGEWKKKGYTIIIKSYTPDIKKRLVEYEMKANIYSVEEKMEMLLNKFPIDSLGFLTEFKDKGRADKRKKQKDLVDKNKYTVLAILRGVKGSIVTFDTLSSTKDVKTIRINDPNGFAEDMYEEERVVLCTHDEWANDYDGEEHPGIEIKELKIDINSLGVEGAFVSNSYIFESLIQKDEKNGKWHSWVNENSNVKREYITKPEYYDIVMRDHGIKINEDKIKIDIDKTKLLLEYNKKNKAI